MFHQCWKRIHLIQPRRLKSNCFSTMSFLREEIRHLKGVSENSVNLLLPHEIPKDSVFFQSQNTSILSLCNPSSKNALTGKMMAEMADAMDILEQEKTITTLVLKGENDNNKAIPSTKTTTDKKNNWFCTGADLKVAQQHLQTRESASLMNTVMVDTLTRLRKLPIISLALIDGGAIGGGAELATACDHRILDSTGYIRFVHVQMGASPGWGGGTRLCKLVGRQRALQLLGKTEKAYAQDSLHWGLVDAIAPSDQLEEKAAQFLNGYCHSNIDAIRGAKAVLAAADDLSFQESTDFERDIFLSLWGNDANRLAVASTLGKKR